MDRKSIDNIDFAQFLRREYPDDPTWKGFFKLWLDAKGLEYGRDDEYIVDGSRDGGIDAIAYPPHGHTDLPIYVVQSKYFQKAIPGRALEKFLLAVSVYRTGNRKTFEKWLEKVRNGSLRTKYRSLWTKRNDIEFVLVTSGHISKQLLKQARKLDIRIEDRRKVKALFIDMARGKTPRPEQITLRRHGKILPILKNKEHGLYVFSAPVADFAAIYQKYPKEIFAGNVRYALSNDTSKDIKKGIRHTLKNRPTEFAYFHNGITIVCKKISSHGSKVRLVSPSIVNGAQTVSFLGDMAERPSSKARVLVKAIVVLADGGFEEFETDVAMSSNTQNKVSLSDLSVIDPDLVSLERFFRARSSFLIRRKGDAPTGTVEVKIDKDRLLQLFACLDQKCGPAATKDKQSLYKNHSGRLFTYYATSVDRKRDAIFLAKLDRFIRVSLREFKLTGKTGERKKRRLSLSFFTIFTVLARLIEDLGMWKKIRAAFADDGLWDSEYSTTLDRDVRKVAGAVLALAKRDAERNDTAFFKNRDKVAQAVKRLRRSLKYKVDFPRC